MKINPAASIYRPQPEKRDMPPGIRELTLDVPESEIREQEKEDKLFLQMDLVGQAVTSLVSALLPLVIVAQIGIWLGWW